MKKGFLTADWLVALAFCVLFALVALLRPAALDSLERAAYDWGVAGSTQRPSDGIAVVAIDEQSIGNIGRFPWPRNIQADMISILGEGGAKVVGNLIIYSEPQTDPGLIYIQQLGALYDAAGFNISGMREVFAEAKQTLNTDASLARAMQRAGNVVLGMTFRLGEPLGNPDAPLPDYLARHFIDGGGPNVLDGIGAGTDGLLPIPVIAPETPPVPEIGEQAASIGHITLVEDTDGGVRIEPLVLRYYDQYVPSFALQVAAASLNLTPADMVLRLGESVQLGRLSIKTGTALEMQTFYYADANGLAPFAVDSFYDVLEGKIPAEKYKDKIVLIGSTAPGFGDQIKTPVDPAMQPVLVAAHTVSSILGEHFFVIPDWSRWVQLAVFALVTAYLVMLLPRLKAGAAAVISLSMLVLLVGAHYLLMTTQATWLQLVTPAVMLVLGHALLTTKRFLVTERGKEISDLRSAETNRMLGLAYQGKGELDSAFASFRKVQPVDDSLLDLIYNLALDFERKRQFNKAVSVYQFITDHNPKFRDVEVRLNRSRNLEETVLLGSAGGASGAQGTLLLDGGGVQKPMLGRYQVDKELGKGAMGVVYLGKDPKINRTVAIKTMALSQEFEADEVDEVKERFFREAETAGRLNHPNIVTIFDAGEEHNLAYIAMEFLKGKDLAPYTKRDALLPVKTVVDIVTKAADALDYAHGENVVHRDIKPANIMYEPEAGSVKLTDFGIARITDSSKTKTGMVLGTPSYMSPEQLSGKKVDGRSNLFSLGVMLYQLLTGRLPFSGDSMATLMFKIANEPHQNVLDLQPGLPPGLSAIIDKALQKNANERYSRGAQMVADLKACVAEMGG